MRISDLYELSKEQEGEVYDPGKDDEQAKLLEFEAVFLTKLKTIDVDLYEFAFTELTALTELCSKNSFEKGFKTAVELILQKEI